MHIYHYNDFVSALLDCGFSMGGGNSEGIFSLINWSWDEEAPYETPVRWHTGDPETDPWEWRMRVLDERQDIAYGKLFFRKSGYITKEWMPYFLAVRRECLTLLDAYERGLISYEAKRIYDVLQEGALPLPAIKNLAQFDKQDKSKFDRALVELQAKLFITMCGRQHKLSSTGEEYGWASTVLCTTEQFWGRDVFEQAERITEGDAIEKIMEQVLRLNPEAEQKKILRFIKG